MGVVAAIAANNQGALDFVRAWQMAPYIKEERFDALLDPKLGSVISLPERDVWGKKLLQTKGRHLLVAAGTCSSCSLDAFNASLVDKTAYASVILIYQSHPDDIKSVRHLGSPSVVSDRDGKLGMKLNAFWSPRFYVIDESRRLLDFQRDGNEKKFTRPNH